MNDTEAALKVWQGVNALKTCAFERGLRRAIVIVWKAHNINDVTIPEWADYESYKAGFDVAFEKASELIYENVRNNEHANH